MKFVVFLVFCFILNEVHSKPSRVDDEVKVIPGYGKPQQTTYAGFVEVNAQYGAYMYYYFIESQGDPSSDPLVLWLQGGPGCSSLFGAFVENGPVLIDANGTLYNNPWSWNQKANLIYIDQPVGTGYSFVEDYDGYVTNENDVAVELYTTITGFFQLHPEYSKSPFYVFGESYAGKYIPSFSHYVWTQNQKNPAVYINLKGIGMGDGWVNPYVQTGSYAPYLYSHGLVNQVEVDAAWASYQTYKALLDIDMWLVADAVGNLLLETLVLAAGDVDVYDIRYTGGDPTDPIGDALTTYLNDPSVRQSLNAGNSTWAECDSQSGLSSDIDQSVADLLPDLLTTYQVLNYNGDQDLICNYMGTLEWTAQIQWPGQNAYVNAPSQKWMVSNSQAGYYKTAGNLTHILVYGAGHMSPFNQPQNTQDLLYRFINGGFN